MVQDKNITKVKRFLVKCNKNGQRSLKVTNAKVDFVKGAISISELFEQGFVVLICVSSLFFRHFGGLPYTGWPVIIIFILYYRYNSIPLFNCWSNCKLFLFSQWHSITAICSIHQMWLLEDGRGFWLWEGMIRHNIPSLYHNSQVSIITMMGLSFLIAGLFTRLFLFSDRMPHPVRCPRKTHTKTHVDARHIQFYVYVSPSHSKKVARETSLSGITSKGRFNLWIS